MRGRGLGAAVVCAKAAEVGERPGTPRIAAAATTSARHEKLARRFIMKGSSSRRRIGGKLAAAWATRVMSRSPAGQQRRVNKDGSRLREPPHVDERAGRKRGDTRRNLRQPIGEDDVRDRG